MTHETSPILQRDPAPAAPAAPSYHDGLVYVGGAFPRSESGRSYAVTDAKGRFLANAAWASRKDCRDAVHTGELQNA